MNAKIKAKTFLRRTIYFLMAFSFAVSIIGVSGLNNKYGFFGLKTNAESGYIDAIDSIKISNIYDKNMIYAAWEKYGAEPNISPELIKSGEEVWFSFEWSVKENDEVKSGDSFTMVFPDIFNHSWINTKSNAELRNDEGILVAMYSIHAMPNGTKAITITFTEAAEDLKDIKGTYGMSIFAVEFYEGETKPITFIINETTIHGGYITGTTPPTGHYEYGDAKYGGRADLKQVIDGYYFFKWTVWINFKFNIIENFSFEDIIPENSLHRFITDDTVAKLGITIPDDKKYLRNITVREYTGADDEPTRQGRYDKFQRNLNNIDGWYENFMETYTFTNGVSSDYPLRGGDGGDGMRLGNINIANKYMNGNLGRLTRPIVIDYYTIAEIKLNESALYDFDVTKQFTNTILGTGLEPKQSVIYEIWVTEESNVTGVKGKYSFSFKKTDENQDALSGAVFSLYTDENCEGGASKFSQSDENGAVVFSELKAGIYYIKETAAPDGYTLPDKIYRVELTESGFTISESGDPENTPVTFIINLPETIDTNNTEETETQTESIVETTEEITEETTKITETTKSTESTVTTTTTATTSDTSVTTTTTATTTTTMSDDTTTATVPTDTTNTTAIPSTTVPTTTVTATTSVAVVPPVTATELTPTTNLAVPDVTAVVITETPSVLTSETMTVGDNINLIPTDVFSPPVPVNAPEAPNVYTTFTVPALPLGYLLLQTEDNIFEIIDDNGVPLGYIVLPDGVSIDDIQYEDIVDMLIPYANIELPDILKPVVTDITDITDATDIPVIPVTPTVTGTDKPTEFVVQEVPKTGDAMILGVLLMTSVGLILFLILEKNVSRSSLRRRNQKNK